MTEQADRVHAIAWGELNHLALATRDLDATLAFYRDVLGMDTRFVGEGNALHGRHGAVVNSVGGAYLHFFEHPQGPVRETDTVTFFTPGHVQHIAFTLPSAEAAHEVRARLTARNVPMTPVMEQRVPGGAGQNFLFLDNNGLQLEAMWRK